MKKTLLIVFTVVFYLFAGAQDKSVPFTLADRDRIIRTEQKVESLHNEMQGLRKEMDTKITSLRNEMNAKFEAVNQKFEAVNERIDAIDKRIDAISKLLYWSLGIIIALILFLLGYIIWDRKTALAPVREKTYSIADRLKDLISALRELAKTDTKLAEVMRTYGLL